MIRGGYNIAPSEVEAVIHRHPDVLEVAVIGVPDEQWGEALQAVVVVREGGVLDADAVTAWCREEGLPTLKVPGEVTFTDSLPKNAVGKVDKGVLRASRWTSDRRV